MFTHESETTRAGPWSNFPTTVACAVLTLGITLLLWGCATKECNARPAHLETMPPRRYWESHAKMDRRVQ